MHLSLSLFHYIMKTISISRLVYVMSVIEYFINLQFSKAKKKVGKNQRKRFR